MLSKQDLLRYILMKFWKKKNIDSYQIKYEENGTYEPYTYTGHVTYVYLMKGLAGIKKNQTLIKEIMSLWFLLLFNMYNIKK